VAAKVFFLRSEAARKKYARRGRDVLFPAGTHTRIMAREIKLNGRELSVMRTIGFGLGLTGTEIQERTQIDPDDLCDLLNTLLDIGYLETPTMKERVPFTDYPTETFEINPSYASDLKAVMRR
jgi:hypothetical protein